ncbi:putative motility protein [Rhodoferax sp.]|uniref:putative motility protein n=1 Tax=Rhodoferax sp. TaxID=50421 RepID=UPI0019FD177D|nr:putative motility protein [Rhodoferax sp.]MBE0473015.1 putative motility protein [Rhodoferax sp.]
MDMSLSLLVDTSMQMQQSQQNQNVQTTVLKKTLDMQAQTAMKLLDSIPLATSGSVGTQINTTA